MNGKTLYEQDHKLRYEKDSALAMGRIISVDPQKRLCRVTTFQSTGNRNDNDLLCQWLSSDAHPDGDESTSIPRVGSYCVVAFVNGVAFVVGFFAPITESGAAAKMDDELGVKELINEGDKLIKTIYKNYIAVRSHGEIEIQATNLCRILLFPDEQQLIHLLCRNFEHRSDGGTIDWINLGYEDNDTFYVAEYRDNIERDNLVIIKRGSDYDNPEIIESKEIGESDPDTTGIKNQVYLEEYGYNGSFKRVINKDKFLQKIEENGEVQTVVNNNYESNIKPDGSVHVKIKKTKFVLDIESDGTSTIKSNGKSTITLNSSGEVKIDAGNGKSVVTISPSGEVIIKSSSKITAEAPDVNLMASNIKLGKSAAYKVPLGDRLLNMLNNNIAKFNDAVLKYNTHNHAGLGAAPPAASIQPMKTITNDVLSSTVKVQK